MAKSKDSAQQPLKTKTLPEGRKDGLFEGTDPVTWVHIAGTAHHFALPVHLQRVTVGSSNECDIVVPSEYMSRQHCTLERRFDCVRIHDHSKNGTYVADRRVLGEPKDVRPGEMFAAGGVTFLALNDQMRRAYPVLCEILDWEQETSLVPIDPGWPTPSQVIQLASGNDHILIAGERGCSQRELAQAIHSISPVRNREIVWINEIPRDRAEQKSLLVRASRTTLVLEIGDGMPIIDEAFRTSLFSTSYRIRVLVVASVRRATEVLGPEHSRMRRIDLRPVAFRSAQLERLLDRQFELNGSAVRCAKLSERNRKALVAHDWPHNLDDVRLAAGRLRVIAAEPSLRKAAATLEVDRSTLQHWFTNTMGLSLPLTSS